MSETEGALIISLEKTFNKARSDGRINLSDILTGIFPCFASMYLSHKSADIIAFGIIFLLIYSWLLRNRIKYAKKVLDLLINDEIPVFTLNNQGIILPVLLLQANDPNLSNLCAAAKGVITIAWKDISEWYVFDGDRLPRGYYLTITENILTPNINKLIIKRDFSQTEEKAIINFVRDYGISVVEPGFWSKNRNF